MNGSSILERQEHPSALRLLAAQRQSYAYAKRFLAAQFILLVFVPCILSALALKYPEIRPWSALVSIAALVFDVLLLEPFLKSNRSRGAGIQEEFDVYVFDLEWPSWKLSSRPDPESIHDASEGIINNPVAKAKLLGWYPIAIQRLNDPRSILLCQRHNIQYGIRIRRIVAVTLLTLVVLMCLTLLAVTMKLNLPLADALLSLAVPALPMLSWSWREYVRQRDHAVSQERIKGAIEKAISEIGNGALGGEKAKVRVRQLQDEILGARMADPLIFDWIYHRMRPKNEKTMAAAAGEYVDALLRIKVSP